MWHTALQDASPFSFHPAKKATRRDDQINPIRSLPWISFAVNCLACALEVSCHIAELAKGAAGYISIMTPIPNGITSDATSTFCTPPKPLPSVEDPSSAACQMLLLHNAPAIQHHLPYAIWCSSIRLFVVSCQTLTELPYYFEHFTSFFLTSGLGPQRADRLSPIA